MSYDLDELEAAVVAVHAAQLPIPTWWPEEERAAFIAEHAGYAFGVLVTELNDVVDRVIDRAAESASAGGRSFSAEEISDLIAIDQQVLLDEARSTLSYDLSGEIVRTSGALLVDLLLARSRHAMVRGGPLGGGGVGHGGCRGWRRGGLL
ncbi:MAG: hypothetical protein K0U84_18695 [Actinomycetia bacterium]|nr:hypothetical protein [Actinomycetes bacterium]